MIGGEKRTIFLMQIKSILHLSFSIFLSIFLLFLLCPFDVSPYLYLISYLPSSTMIAFSSQREQNKVSAVCFMGSHLILPDSPFLEGCFPSGTFVCGTDGYGRPLQRVLCFWNASQPAPLAPSPSSLNPNSSCSDAKVITLFF